jgi:hypothetical protein
MKFTVVTTILTFLLALAGSNLIFAAEEVVSMPVEQSPTIDGKVDAVWDTAKELVVPVAGGANAGKATVHLKSVHTTDSIYFLVQWDDPIESLQRSPWQKQADGTWKKLVSPDSNGDENKYYEDKLAFLWNIDDSIAGFNEAGCLVTCHLGEGKPFGNKYTNKDGEKGDIWHWKSVRTGPVGQIDDQYLDSTRYDKDKSPEAGRKSDPKTGGGYVNNDNNDKTGPAFTAANQPGTYWIFDSEKQPFTDTYKAGDEIAGIIVAPFVGDRGDISCKSVYANGAWTLEMGRKRNTGSAFDVQFTDTAKTYYFGVSAFDNAQVRHSWSGAIALRFAGVPVSEKDYSNVFFMVLEPGLNMVSLPLEPKTPYTARSLAKELNATAVIRLDAKRSRFVGFTVDTLGEGFPIEGGHGYIVNVEKGKTVAFMGAAWTNQPPVPAAPMTVRNSAWAFVASGTLMDENHLDKSHEGYTIIAKNLRTGVVVMDAVSSENGGFAAVWADLNRKSVVEVGDVLEIVALDSTGNRVAGPIHREIATPDIGKAFVSVNLRLGDIIPASSALLQNFPNPFNPETWIPFQLSESANVKIHIYDAFGKIIKTVDLGHRQAGIYLDRSTAAFWNGRTETGEQAASGIYFYQIKADTFTQTRKMILVK